MKKLIIDKNNPNGILVDMSYEEINELNENASKHEIEMQQEQEDKINKENKKASGKQKLLNLGLTEEEVKALIGV
jgi:hypothetical protein